MRRNLMKKGIYPKLIFILISSIFLTSTLSGLGTSSPVHYWSMDDYFGQSTGNPTLESNDCVQGNCISFSGRDCISDGPGFNTISSIQNLVTFSMWIKTGSDVNSLQYIFTQNGADFSSGNEVAKRGIFIQNGKVNAFINPEFGPSQTIDGYSVISNKWYFISFVQNNINSYLYIGGGGNIQQNISDSVNNYGYSWNFGCSVNNNDFFKGKLDEINVYSSAFTQNQIFQEYSKYQDPNLIYTKNVITTTTTSSNIFSIFSLKSIIDFILVFLIITIPIYTVFSTRKVSNNSLMGKIKLRVSHYSQLFGNRSRTESNTPNSNRIVAENGNRSNFKLCSQCGSRLQSNDQFCPNCGVRVTDY